MTGDPTTPAGASSSKSSKGNAPRVSLIADLDASVGDAVVRRLCRRGDRVVIGVLRDDAWPESLAAELGAHGGLIDIEQVGSADADPERLAAATASRYGGIDVLVNGIAALARSSGDKSSGAGEAIDNLARRIGAVAPHMASRGGGQIVNLISAAGRYRSNYFRAVAEAAEDGAARASIDGAAFALTRQLAFELAGDRIRINAVCLGWIRSPAGERAWHTLTKSERAWLLEEISLGRLGEPDEVAAVVEFLSAPTSSYVTGNAIDVNGGWWMS